MREKPAPAVSLSRDKNAGGTGVEVEEALRVYQEKQPSSHLGRGRNSLAAESLGVRVYSGGHWPDGAWR